MTAVDTNVLVHAHRRDSRWHARAAGCLRRLAEGRAAWAIPWPCLHEFLAIVTHPRIYEPPSTVEEALDQIDAWMESPALVILAEPHDHWSILRRQLAAAQVQGPMVHDARIAAICIGHGVHELLTADRDFGRFSSLAARNPLVG
ncbi:MAG: type II toxin-antitoxin system VapC family toxin [Acidobacteria bacterium]|nr:type II toxin-antitoxin system VapC family toxin [Acidobacteriota bacterium]